MDPLEEQLMELEALESIYPEELHNVSKEEPISFEVHLQGEKTDDDIQGTLLLTFKFPSEYPNVLPEIEAAVQGCELLDGGHTTIMAGIENEGTGLIGMAMVFQLCAHAKELFDAELQRLQEDHERRVQEEFERREAEENKRFVGTPVTAETFREWLRKFTSEMREKRGLKAEQDPKRVTGKDMWLTNKEKMEESEAAAYAQDGDIDESLFTEGA
eukprot:Clim_evm5s235 gene=Clim_evmTU5s235